MPIQPLLSFLETGRQPWAPWGVAAGLAGLGPGPHSDGQVLGRRLGPMPQGYAILNEVGLNIIFQTVEGAQSHPIKRWMGPD